MRLFSLQSADRRATARTTNFVEPCSFQQKKNHPRPLLRHVSLRTFSHMRRRALSSLLWSRLKPDWRAEATPTVETERQIQRKFDARDNRNLVDRFAKSHERAAHATLASCRAELASLRGHLHSTFSTCTSQSFLILS